MKGFCCSARGAPEDLLRNEIPGLRAVEALSHLYWCFIELRGPFLRDESMNPLPTSQRLVFLVFCSRDLVGRSLLVGCLAGLLPACQDRIYDNKGCAYNSNVLPKPQRYVKQ